MRFRHAFCILADNFSDTLKLLLYRLVVTVIFGSIGYVILKLGLSSVTASAEVARLKEVVLGFLSALFTGKTTVLSTFQADIQTAFSDVVTLVANHSASIIGCAVGLVLIYLVSRFVNGLAVFALGGVVNDRMSAFARTRFSRSYFKWLGSASLYQAIYVPLCFVYDVLSLLACWFFFFYAPSLIGTGFLTVLLAISLTALAMVALQALKMTLVSAWMPRIIAGGEKVGRAFCGSFACGKDFGGRFVGFLVTAFTVLVVNAAAVFFTFGSALVLTIPASYMLFLCMQFVNFYRDGHRRYFVSRTQIVEDPSDPTELQP